MQKVQIRAQIARHGFVLDRDQVERALQDAVAEPVRDHYVVVGGRRYPVKQALAAVTGLDRADFTTVQARSVLRRLGFTTDRLSAPRGPSETGVPRKTERSGGADVLRAHRGRWVALRGDDVLIAADSPTDVLAWLERHDERADTLFRVPVDPTVDMGGFPA